MAVYNILTFDYRGYGKSAGRPDLAGLHIDAMAAIDEAWKRWGPQNFFVLGQSIGGSVAIYAAANYSGRQKIKGVIVDSAYFSLREIVREKAALFFLTWPFQHLISYTYNDSFSPANWVEKLSPIPLLVMHGETDRQVPLAHGQKIYRQAKEPKTIWQTKPEGHIRSFADPQIRHQLLNYLQGKQ